VPCTEIVHCTSCIIVAKPLRDFFFKVVLCLDFHFDYICVVGKKRSVYVCDDPYHTDHLSTN